MYIVKLVVFFAIGGITVATADVGTCPPSGMLSQWWNQPIVYQKVNPVTRAYWKTIGHRRIVGSAGRQDQADDRRHSVLDATGNHPACGQWEVGTVHQRRTGRNWFDNRALPGPAGESGSCLCWSAVVHSDSLSKAVPANISGLVNSRAGWVAPLVLTGADRSARQRPSSWPARGEQYFPALFFFAVSAIHRHDHRAQDADRAGVGGRRLLEVR